MIRDGLSEEVTVIKSKRLLRNKGGELCKNMGDSYPGWEQKLPRPWGGKMFVHKEASMNMAKKRIINEIEEPAHVGLLQAGKGKCLELLNVIRNLENKRMWHGLIHVFKQSPAIFS